MIVVATVCCFTSCVAGVMWCYYQLRPLDDDDDVAERGAPLQPWPAVSPERAAQGAESAAAGLTPQRLDSLPVFSFSVPRGQSVATADRQPALGDITKTDVALERDAPRGLDGSHAQCAVCLEEYAEGDSLMALPCNHVFHAACVRLWLPGSRLCPLCKSDVVSTQFPRPPPQHRQGYYRL